MFSIRKRMEVSAAHTLDLSYESACKRLHGHNWIIEVTIEGPHLNKEGMLVDFKKIKEVIHGQLDHRNISAIIPSNPTAENIALWVSQEIEKILNGGSAYVTQVEVQESEGNKAIWKR